MFCGAISKGRTVFKLENQKVFINEYIYKYKIYVFIFNLNNKATFFEVTHGPTEYLHLEKMLSML